jgi:hypothetical protein
MTTSAASEPLAPVPLPIVAVADLQDHLLVASNDLERLQRLLQDAGDTLMANFLCASQGLAAITQATGPAAAVAEPVAVMSRALAAAVTALQFQDMSFQLIGHTTKRLRNCADRLACDAFGEGDGDGVVEPLPLRPNPVTQDEMDAGSVELF